MRYPPDGRRYGSRGPHRPPRPTSGVIASLCVALSIRFSIYKSSCRIGLKKPAVRRVGVTLINLYYSATTSCRSPVIDLYIRLRHDCTGDRDEDMTCHCLHQIALNSPPSYYGCGCANELRNTTHRLGVPERVCQPLIRLVAISPQSAETLSPPLETDF